MTKQQKLKLHKEFTGAHSDFVRDLNARAFFKLGDRETCQDLVQETFLKTWKYIVRGGKIEIMKAFLYHILNNLIIDEYRKRKNSSLDAMLENGFDPSAEDEAERPINAIDGKTALSLIKKLPEKYQRVMQMKYTQNLTLQEMSLATGQSKNSIAVQSYRGLEKLKSLYNYSN